MTDSDENAQGVLGFAVTKFENGEVELWSLGCATGVHAVCGLRFDARPDGELVIVCPCPCHPSPVPYGPVRGAADRWVMELGFARWSPPELVEQVDDGPVIGVEVPGVCGSCGFASGQLPCPHCAERDDAAVSRG